MRRLFKKNAFGPYSISNFTIFSIRTIYSNFSSHDKVKLREKKIHAKN